MSRLVTVSQDTHWCDGRRSWHFDGCFCCCDCHSNSKQSSQVNWLTYCHKSLHITLFLKLLHWLPVGCRFQFKILVPTFLQTRFSDPWIRAFQWFCVTEGDWDFQILTSKLRSSFPLSLCTRDSVTAYKEQLKTHLFKQVVFVLFCSMSCVSVLPLVRDSHIFTN